jgi:3-hydroxyacyl-[acyl-carrier-protein] dehydratase
MSNTEHKTFGPFDIHQILSFLPHRPPFLFLDKVEEVKVPFVDGKMIQVGTMVRACKLVTINEPYFVGHFPNQPIMPGVIQIETVAQAASYALYPWVKDGIDDMKREDGFDLRLAGVDRARFRRPVFPGDKMSITAEVTKYRSPLWGFQCKVETEAGLVMECELLASVSFGGKKV